jgi:hypothetical protein
MLPGSFENGQRAECRSSEISGLIGVACCQRGWHVLPVPDVIDITLCGWQVLRNNLLNIPFSLSFSIIAAWLGHHASAALLLSAGFH